MSDVSSFQKREGFSSGGKKPANGRSYSGRMGQLKSPSRFARSKPESAVTNATVSVHSKSNKSGKHKSLDLADHFLGCVKLGRYLTVADNSRFVITDDFRSSSIIPAASAMAAIYSRDHLVAQAALLPLSTRIKIKSVKERDKLEELFLLIEEQTLSEGVRNSAQGLRQYQFRESQIRDLEVELGNRLSPARLRYRQFLDVIRKLMDRRITAGPFLDEFRSFTQDVAGKLDFGIYSFCLDRLFGSVKVSMKVKKLLTLEVIGFPTLIRRELLSNLLVFPGQAQELTNFIRYMIATELGQNVAIEIKLLEAFKKKRLSIQDIETSLARSG
ncbi:MAG: hypothetical protein CMF69_12575 [Magnetovibrio sp.]|nr:hypothetical protein [Magnetovibrio sp.]